MQLVHREVVTRVVEDPNSPSGLREIHQRRISDTRTISHQGTTYERGEDGTFDVPAEVGVYFTKGTTGHGFPGWSAFDGGDPAVGLPPAPVDNDRLAALEARFDGELAAAKARAEKAEAELAALKAKPDSTPPAPGKQPAKS